MMRSLRLLMLLILSLVSCLAVAQERAEPLYDGASGNSVNSASGSRYTLLVGVQNYKNGVKPLQYTLNDVHALFQALTGPTGGFLSDNVMLLADDAVRKPTLGEITVGLKWLQRTTEPNDTVFIYFAGHGTYDGDISYLLCQDTVPAAVETTGLNVLIFNKLVRDIPARKKIVVLDACHSGGVNQAARGGSDSMSVDMYRDLHNSSQGEIRILSCQQEEQSYETAKLGNGRGVFSHFLVKALTEPVADVDRNGLLMASELETYLALQVRGWAAKQGWEQTPVFDKKLSGGFILATLGKGQSSKSSGGELVTYATAAEVLEVGKLTSALSEEVIFNRARLSAVLSLAAAPEHSRILSRLKVQTSKLDAVEVELKRADRELDRYLKGAKDGWTAFSKRDLEFTKRLISTGRAELEGVSEVVGAYEVYFEANSPRKDDVLEGTEAVAALSIPTATGSSVQLGRELFLQNCAMCHGDDADGKGAAAAALDPLPTDLRRLTEYKYGFDERALFRSIGYGVEGTGMAPFGDILETNEIWSLVHYLRDLVAWHKATRR